MDLQKREVQPNWSKIRGCSAAAEEMRKELAGKMDTEIDKLLASAGWGELGATTNRVALEILGEEAKPHRLPCLVGKEVARISHRWNGRVSGYGGRLFKT